MADKFYSDYADTHKEGVCPVCGCQNLEYGEFELGDDGGFYAVTCPSCRATFNEHYDFYFAGHWNIKVNEC